MSDIYYVYTLIDPRNQKVFYVGEGKNNRAWSHAQFKSGCNNPHKDRIIHKIHKCGLQVIVSILHQNLTKPMAQKLQDDLISEIGLENLTNICPSANPPVLFGEANGFYRKTHTEESRIKIGNTNRGKDLKTPEGKAAIAAAIRKKWQEDTEWREANLARLKTLHLHRRKLTFEEWSSAAKKREQQMTQEQKEERQRKSAATQKANNAGKKRVAYRDASNKLRFKWIPISD